MSEANTTTTQEIKEMAEKASDLAKNIWLAGLGAYGKALDEAQDQYEKVSSKTKEESTRLFDELVAKGKKLEDETSDKLNEVKEKSSASLEDRLAQVKDSLSFTAGGKGDVAEQLEEVSKKLDLVIEALGAKSAPAKKAPAKKAAAKKTAE